MDQLQARLDDYQQRNTKPLLVQEIGYHSWADAPYNQRDELGQAELLGQAANIIEQKNITGWVIWTAFDFVPNSGQTTHFEYHFGLWDTNLRPKPALEKLLPTPQ